MRFHQKSQIKSASVRILVLFTFIPLYVTARSRGRWPVVTSRLCYARWKMAALRTVSGNAGMISLVLLCVIAAAESDEQVPLVAWASDG